MDLPAPSWQWLEDLAAAKADEAARKAKDEEETTVTETEHGGEEY